MLSLRSNTRTCLLPTIKRGSILPKPVYIQGNRREKLTMRKVITKSFDMTYYFGKSIILFTLFYCSMNWRYYRGTRKDLEDIENEEFEDKDGDNKV